MYRSTCEFKLDCAENKIRELIRSKAKSDAASKDEIMELRSGMVEYEEELKQLKDANWVGSIILILLDIFRVKPLTLTFIPKFTY